MARKQTAPTDDAPVEILDEAGGPELGIDFGIIVGTTIVLIGAVLLVMYALGEHYGKGPFGN